MGLGGLGGFGFLFLEIFGVGGWEDKIELIVDMLVFSEGWMVFGGRFRRGFERRFGFELGFLEFLRIYRRFVVILLSFV